MQDILKYTFKQIWLMENLLSANGVDWNMQEKHIEIKL